MTYMEKRRTHKKLMKEKWERYLEYNNFYKRIYEWWDEETAINTPNLWYWWRRFDKWIKTYREKNNTKNISYWQFYQRLKRWRTYEEAIWKEKKKMYQKPVRNY